MNEVQAGSAATPLRVAIFASGSGSNFQAIVDAVRSGALPNVSIELLVCDRAEAKVVERAHHAGVPSFLFSPKDYSDRAAYEKEILAELAIKQIDLVVLAGYMRIITEILVEPYAGRMINIHPSLLPAFPGLNAIGQALAHGVKVTGVTVHFVDGGMDTGPIIAQHPVVIEEGETEARLTEKIHQVEHRLYIEVIRLIAAKLVHVEGRCVRIAKVNSKAE